MKKFTLSMIAVLLTAFVLTSCIDDAVSSEVKALRAAQLNLLNANIALVNANVAHTTALAAVANSQAAVNNADAAMTAAETTRYVAETALKVAEYEADIVEAELDLQEAIDDLAEYIAQHPTDQAAIYLTNYSTASDAARTIAEDIADEIKDLALLQAYFSTEDPKYAATIEARNARALAEAQATLEIAQASLATILAVGASSADAAAAYADVKTLLQDITNQKLAIDVVLSATAKELELAGDAVSDAEDAIDVDTNGAGDADGGFQGILDDAEADQTAIDDAIADVAAELADANAATADDQAELEPFVSRLEVVAFNNLTVTPQINALAHRLNVAINAARAEAALTVALVTIDPAADNSDGWDAAIGDLEDVYADIEEFCDTQDNIGDPDATDVYGDTFTDLTGNYSDGDWDTDDLNAFIGQLEGVLNAPDGESDAGSTEGLYNAIKAFFNDNYASDLVDDIGRYAAGDYVAYVTELGETLADGGTVTEVDFDDMPETTGGDVDGSPFGAYFDKLDALHDAVLAYDDEYVFDTWENLAADAAAASVDLATAVADAQADLDAAEADLADAEDAKAAIDDARQSDVDAKAVLVAEELALGPVKEALEALLGICEDCGGINADIAAFQEDVDEAQDDVDEAEYAIAEWSLEKTRVAEFIAAAEVRIAELQEELTAQQEVAAAWFALLTAVLG